MNLKIKAPSKTEAIYLHNKMEVKVLICLKKTLIKTTKNRTETIEVPIIKVVFK